MYSIRKEFSFCASHFLRDLKEGHPCTRLHGHNYKVILHFASSKLNKNGFVIDYRDLDVVKDWIDKTFDHRNLNDVLIGQPSAENIAFHIFYKVKDIMHTNLLTKVEVSETDKTFASYEPGHD